MMHPPFLNIGDTIGILSTARKTSREAMENAGRIIRSYGFKVRLSPNLLAEENQFAGSDEMRIKDMHTFLEDKDIKAIFCARGGYGTTRIIDKIDWSLIEQNPKWLCGFSDVTAILCHLHKLGLESMHSIMAAQFDEKEPDRKKSMDSLFSLLMGEPFSMKSTCHPFNRSGLGSGEIIGGNLSILNNLVGTLSDPDYDGKILFLEDLDEYLYHIDRMMVHLKRCGKLEKLAGLVVGQMSDMNDNPIPFGKSAYDIIREHVDEYTFPVAYTFPIGHAALNLAVPVGRRTELSVSVNKGGLLTQTPSS